MVKVYEQVVIMEYDTQIFCDLTMAIFLILCEVCVLVRAVTTVFDDKWVQLYLNSTLVYLEPTMMAMKTVKKLVMKCLLADEMDQVETNLIEDLAGRLSKMTESSCLVLLVIKHHLMSSVECIKVCGMKKHVNLLDMHNYLLNFCIRYFGTYSPK
jgi:hypothetical protein